MSKDKRVKAKPGLVDQGSPGGLAEHEWTSANPVWRYFLASELLISVRERLYWLNLPVALRRYAAAEVGTLSNMSTIHAAPEKRKIEDKSRRAPIAAFTACGTASERQRPFEGRLDDERILPATVPRPACHPLYKVV
jgi:hypothetical protein